MSRGRANAGTNSIRGSRTEDEDGQQATGVGYADFIDRMIQLRIERHEGKQKN